MTDTHTPEILTTRAGVPVSRDYALSRHSRGSLRMQTTIAVDPRMTGQRITIPLHTHDLDEARQRRDIVLDALSKVRVLSSKAGITSAHCPSSKIC